MKSFCKFFCLLIALQTTAWATTRMVVSGGVMRDGSGATLAPGSMVALVASTQDNVFGVPAANSTLQVGATFGGDDVVLAVFPVGPQTTGVAGGFLGVVTFDYAQMGIPNLNAGDQLKLYWFPAASLNGNQIRDNAAYGSFRADTVTSQSNSPWLAPDDALGATLELNFRTLAISGDLDNSVAIAGMNVTTSDAVTVVATDSSAGEPSNPGTFTFTRGGSTTSALTINFAVSGTATAGSDYTSIGTTATFAAGSATTTVQVNVIDDAVVEGDETVVVTLTSGSGYSVGSANTATVTIQDDDSSTNVITVAATSPATGEPGSGLGPGVFTFTRSGASTSALTANFTVSGTATSGSDYTAIGTSVNFAAGSATATKTINVIDDAVVEGDETVIVTLTSGSGYSVGSANTATVTIQDDDSSTNVITVVATSPATGEPGSGLGPGIFTFTRSGASTSALTVNFTVSGTATSGSDYTAIGTSVNFAAGSATATKTINVVDDAQTEASETVVVTLSSGAGYAIGSPASDTVTIQDDDSGTTTATSYVTGATLGAIRNNYSGWVGMEIVIGASPVTITQLGRMAASGNTGTHTVKLVKASDGLDVPGGAVTIATSGATTGQFVYGTLASPVTLSAGGAYFLLSQEVNGGDTWREYDTTVTTTNVASVITAIYGTSSSNWASVGGANHTYIPIDFKYSSPPPAATSYVTGATLGTIRNDYSGWVGMEIVIGASPVTITQLGRMAASGNTGTHTVKLVKASDGLDVAGGAVTIGTSGATVGQFVYGTLTSPVTLAAGGAYFLLSQEVNGGDTWREYDTTVTTTNVASVMTAIYGTSSSNWASVGGANHTYIPVDFKYSPPQSTGTSYVTGAALGAIRNNYSGWVGMEVVIGASPVTITQLGRMAASGNTGAHTVKLVKASDGLDVAGGAVTIATSGATTGQFVYGTLASPVTLAAGGAYFLLSQEVNGGDTWREYDTTVTTTNVASVITAIYGTSSSDWASVGGANHTYIPVDFKYSPPQSTGTSYVTGAALGAIRNNYSGWVGMEVVIGASPVTITQLGRMAASGNTGAHTVKLVKASDGLDVPGGAVTIATSGATTGQFVYGTLASPVTLAAGGAYFLLSQEVNGGDTWREYDTTVTTTNVASVITAIYGTSSSDWASVGGANHTYIPVDFKY